MFRIKSAKQDKRIASKMNTKKLILEETVQQRQAKMTAAMHRKRMQDMEEEAKREKKLQDYNKKAAEI